MSTLDETRLAEALGPEPNWATMSEEDCIYQKGRRLSEETKFRLLHSNDPNLSLRFQALYAEFAYDEPQGSIHKQQRGLSIFFTNHPILQAKYSSFINAPLNTEEQCREAKAILCNLFGLPCQIRSKETLICFRESIFFHNTLNQLHDPYIFDGLIERPDAIIMKWKPDIPRDSVYRKLQTIFEEKGESDLLKGLPFIWHGWDYGMEWN